MTEESRRHERYIEVAWCDCGMRHVMGPSMVMRCGCDAEFARIGTGAPIKTRDGNAAVRVSPVEPREVVVHTVGCVCGREGITDSKLSDAG